MTALPMVKMEEQQQAAENQSVQREVDRMLLKLRNSKAFIRAVGHTMGNGGYGSIKLDIARGKVKRVVSEAVFLEDD